MNKDKYVKLAAVVGALAVMLGAFGAHGLQYKLTDYQLSIFKIGVQYHMIHAVLLLFLSIVMHHSKVILISYYCILVGIVLFAGSLYLLASKDILGISDGTWLGMITPLGGLSFIAGWLNLVRYKTHH
ncbi:MAG: DUF423 domain-containing protein [Lewinellaceae bacterium]|nr:DUF423 domain-containing protein [Lewinellaceae bacterium]